MGTKVSDKYLDLIRSFPLRPIKSDAELDRAAAVMRSLIDKPRLTAAEDDYLIILGSLIEEYETKHYPIEPLPPHKMLEQAMIAKGVNQVELSEATGISVSTISELLRRKREINLAHIKKFSSYFGIEPSAFITKNEAVPAIDA